jgi:hypothetical protein
MSQGRALRTALHRATTHTRTCALWGLLMAFPFRSHSPSAQLHTRRTGDAQPNSDVEAAVRAIEAAGMAVPASIALQVGKPLSWIGGQLLWVLQPFTDALGVGGRRHNSPITLPGLARLLEQDGGVERLAQRLDAGLSADTGDKSGGGRG